MREDEFSQPTYEKSPVLIYQCLRIPSQLIVNPLTQISKFSKQ